MGRDPAQPPNSAQLGRMVAAWSLVHGFAMLLIDGRLEKVLSQHEGGPDWQPLLHDVLRPPGRVSPGS